MPVRWSSTTSSETKLSACPGTAKSAGGTCGQVLELTHGLPADEADESAGERRVTVDVRRAPARVEVRERVERRGRGASEPSARSADSP